MLDPKLVWLLTMYSSSVVSLKIYVFMYNVDRFMDGQDEGLQSQLKLKAIQVLEVFLFAIVFYI